MNRVDKGGNSKRRLTRRLIAGGLILSVILAFKLPLPAYADGPYDLRNGNITIYVGSDGKTWVSQPDNNNLSVLQTSAVIITSYGVETSNSVSISAYAGNTANVIFSDLKISIASNLLPAAVTTVGNVTIELDGTNTLQSGYGHAGLEKSDTAGLLTIKDDTNDGGSLTAIGGVSGAGIGGGSYLNMNTDNIKIEGGNITAIGGSSAAGIGGSTNENGSNITITGGVVFATGGTSGAGIGGGYEGTGSNITISGTARVYVAGGAEHNSNPCAGKGAAIGDGGSTDHGQAVDGVSVAPNTTNLTTGTITEFPGGTSVQEMMESLGTSQGSGSSSSSSSSSTSSHRHVHSYSWVVTIEPTAYANGEMVYQCSCGHIKDRAEIEASSKLVTEGIRSFSASAQGATATMDFGNYISINKAFATAHDARPDLTTVITYNYQGQHYEMTIPAGFDLLQTINEDGWAGFRFIDSFPGVTSRQLQ